MTHLTFLFSILALVLVIGSCYDYSVIQDDIQVTFTNALSPAYIPNSNPNLPMYAWKDEMRVIFHTELEQVDCFTHIEITYCDDDGTLGLTPLATDEVYGDPDTIFTPKTPLNPGCYTLTSITKLVPQPLSDTNDEESNSNEENHDNQKEFLEERELEHTVSFVVLPEITISDDFLNPTNGRYRIDLDMITNRSAEVRILFNLAVNEIPHSEPPRIRSSLRVRDDSKTLDLVHAGPLPKEVDVTDENQMNTDHSQAVGTVDHGEPTGAPESREKSNNSNFVHRFRLVTNEHPFHLDGMIRTANIYIDLPKSVCDQQCTVGVISLRIDHNVHCNWPCTDTSNNKANINDDHHANCVLVSHTTLDNPTRESFALQTVAFFPGLQVHWETNERTYSITMTRHDQLLEFVPQGEEVVESVEITHPYLDLDECNIYELPVYDQPHVDEATLLRGLLNPDMWKLDVAFEASNMVIMAIYPHENVQRILMESFERLQKEGNIISDKNQKNDSMLAYFRQKYDDIALLLDFSVEFTDVPDLSKNRVWSLGNFKIMLMQLLSGDHIKIEIAVPENHVRSTNLVGFVQWMIPLRAHGHGERADDHLLEVLLTRMTHDWRQLCTSIRSVTRAHPTAPVDPKDTSDEKKTELKENSESNEVERIEEVEQVMDDDLSTEAVVLDDLPLFLRPGDVVRMEPMEVFIQSTDEEVDIPVQVSSAHLVFPTMNEFELTVTDDGTQFTIPTFGKLMPLMLTSKLQDTTLRLVMKYRSGKERTVLFNTVFQAHPQMSLLHGSPDTNLEIRIDKLSYEMFKSTKNRAIHSQRDSCILQNVTRLGSHSNSFEFLTVAYDVHHRMIETREIEGNGMLIEVEFPQEAYEVFISYCVGINSGNCHPIKVLEFTHSPSSKDTYGEEVLENSGSNHSETTTSSSSVSEPFPDADEDQIVVHEIDTDDDYFEDLPEEEEEDQNILHEVNEAMLEFYAHINESKSIQVWLTYSMISITLLGVLVFFYRNKILRLRAPLFSIKKLVAMTTKIVHMKPRQTGIVSVHAEQQQQIPYAYQQSSAQPLIKTRRIIRSAAGLRQKYRRNKPERGSVTDGWNILSKAKSNSMTGEAISPQDLETDQRSFWSPSSKRA